MQVTADFILRLTPAARNELLSSYIGYKIDHLFNEASIQSVTHTQSASTVKSELESEVEPEIEPEVESEVKPEVEPEVESEVESEVEPEVESEVEPEVE